MQVLVRKSDIAADCTCSICGQGFSLYWETGTAEEQARAHIEVRDAIHAQHLHSGGRSAHPEVPFTVPNWHSMPQFAVPERLGARFSLARPAELSRVRPS